ncbi:MAG: SDR family NAD(P)-dependent oxidoreductase, partial [bacterium]|nr:SDR family NAD(P)-dependent oxidoreductase [bacterium]
PELGNLNLSTGGAYPVQYALRLGAGFGSQLAMSLTRWTPSPDGRRRNPDQLGFGYRISDPQRWQAWQADVSGYDQVELEIVSRRLRIKDQGPPQRAAAEVPAVTAKPAVTVAPAAPAVHEAPAAPPPAPEPAAKAVPETPAPAAVAQDDVEEQVIRIVAEKTDYPPDMLDLDLDLEADLGVDTVKQAEVFAAIRGHYDIPRDENLKLSEFPTLTHVVGFVRERRPDLPVAAAPAQAAAATAPEPVVAVAPVAPAPAEPAAAADDVEEQVIRIVAEKTDYPPDMLELDLDLEADLGVDTVKQAEVFAAVRGHYNIPRDENLKLSEFPTLTHVVGFVRERRPDQPSVATPAPAPAAAPEAPAAAEAVAVMDDVEEQVIRIVAEKTDYPPDMLELDLDLEADLGVDTVKQAEVFAAIRGHYDIPRDENLKLSEFPTLTHVVGFVRDRRPDQPAVATPAPEPAVAAEPEAPAAPASAGTDDAAITQRVLTIVAEMTGYPEDMLEMDLDLEADLGVDTVKQAEIFAAMRESYGIPRDPDLQLKDFPTLNHAVQFVKDRMPTDETAVTAEPTTAPEQAPSEEAVTGDMEAANAVPRRVPTAVWRPPLDVCCATSVELGEGSRVIVMPDSGGVGHALAERLQKRGVEVLMLEAGADAGAIEQQVAAWLQEGPVTGLYWLPAMDPHADIAEMDEAVWQEAVEQRVMALYATAQSLYDTLTGSDQFVIAGTRLGGRHGYEDAGAINPLGGAVCGFVKALKREKNDVLCKVVDFATSRKTAALADQLIEETLQDPGVVEIGRDDAGRWTIGLREVPCDGSDTGLELNSESVFVVTGAAGSIVSAIIADLATASGGTFHLLDLTPEPDRDDADIARFATDRDGLKRDIFERIKASGERATPAMVEKELARLERAQAALAAIEAVESAGGTAHYHSVDLTDSAGVTDVMESILTTSGRIDVLVHAAGVEISRFLADKPRDEFALVFDVKSRAWHSMMRAIGDAPLKAAVVFSSVAGRFGNGGQTDYSAANDFLTKCVMGFANSRPDTRGIAIDWTAWGGIGMATRGSIPTMMAAAGIDLLPPEAGIPIVRRELTQGPTVTEIVVGQRLGVLTEEWDAAGGLAVDALQTDETRGPMLGDVVGMTLAKGLTVETELDPKDQAFLHDHKIEGTPVLPGVMGLEAFAELSTLLLPEYRVESIDDVQFMVPFKFYRDEPRRVRLTAQFAEVDGEFVAYCALEGERTIQTQPEPVVTKHFTATVRLTRDDPEVVQVDKPKTTAEASVDSDLVYQVYFHGPAYQVLESAWG